MLRTYQFNRMELQRLQRGLSMRESALPTLKSRESALRVEVQKQKGALELLKMRYGEGLAELNRFGGLWAEFPGDAFLPGLTETRTASIAGVRVPVLERIVVAEKPYSRFHTPAWVGLGITALRNLTELAVRIETAQTAVAELERVRRKVTQKVNLYEKVHIPELEGAILRIKCTLEDVENLEKAAQKITKRRLRREEGGE